MNGIDAALTLMLSLINQSAAISTAIRNARSQGRDLNATDWQLITDRDDVAAAGQVAALAKAQSEGR